MTIASEISRIKNAIQNAYTACSLKGAILPFIQDSSNLYNCINTIDSGPIPVGTILTQFDRVNGVSTVAGFWTDLNNQRYAVCVLDAQYRTRDKLKAQSTDTAVLPYYKSAQAALETCISAKISTDMLIENNLLSDNNGFYYCYNDKPICFLDGKLFYSYLPNLGECAVIAENYTYLDNIDPTSGYSTYNFDYFFARGTTGIWSTEQKTGGTSGYRYKGYGVTPGSTSKTSSYGLCPIYEIPVDENGRVL